MVALGAPGTVVAGDDEGALYLVGAAEARAVDLGVSLAGGGPLQGGPAVADGGGQRFTLVASAQGGDPVLIDAEEGAATALAEVVELDEALWASRFSPDERHLAVVASDGLHLVVTEGAEDLGVVAGPRLGVFTPAGDALWATRPAVDGGGDGEDDGGDQPEEVVRVPVDDPAAVEVVTTAHGIVLLAAFADRALGLQDGRLVLIDGEGARPVDVGGEPDGAGLAGAGEAVVRVDRGDDRAIGWVRVGADGEIEESPQLDGLVVVGGRSGVLVLADADLAGCA